MLEFTIGGSRDGTIQAYRLDMIQDAGAYPVFGALPAAASRADGERRLRIPKIEVRRPVGRDEHDTGRRRSAAPDGPRRRRRSSARSTSSPPRSGSTRPRCDARTSSRPTRFRYTTASHATYDSGDYERALDLALETAGYDDLREEQRGGAKRATRQLGIGLSIYVEITNGRRGEYGAVEITPDGGAIVRTGSFSHGQGHETTFAMIVAERPASRSSR